MTSKASRVESSAMAAKMKMMSFQGPLPFFFLFLLLTACAGSRQREDDVRVVVHKNLGKCQHLQALEVEQDTGPFSSCDDRCRIERLKQETVELGGNTLTVAANTGHLALGNAFHCQKPESYPERFPAGLYN